MEITKNFCNKELENILKTSAVQTSEKGGKDVSLSTVLYNLINTYLINGSGEEDELMEYLVDIFGDNLKRKISHLQKLSEGEIEKNKLPDEFNSFRDSTTLPASVGLDSVLERSKRLIAHFNLGTENGKLTSSCFLFTAMFEQEDPVVKTLSRYGIKKSNLVMIIGLVRDEGMDSLSLLEKTLDFMDPVVSDNESEEKGDNKESSSSSEESNKKISDDFEKAGQRGSVSSKKIDPNSPTPFLDEFAFDMTQASKEGKYDPVVGREREIGSLIEILSCRKKNNAILLGEPGCGKTSVVEALVSKIARKEVPLVLQNKRVVSLDLNALVAGAIYRGEYEKRLQGIIKEVVETKDVIVFIDEVHNLIGNGSSSGQGDGANILKPYLARGEFQIIGATTKTEYRVIEKDGALKRRFQNVVIEDPSVVETVDILSTVQEKYSQYHKVKYTPEVLSICSKWSEKYIPDRHLPDKAIDIMDMAGSLCKLRKVVNTEELEKLRSELELVIEEKISAVINSGDYVKGMELREKEMELNRDIERIESTILSDGDNPKKWPTVTLDDVADVVSKITNIPVDKIKSTDSEKIKELQTSLLENIIGQDEAVKQVVKVLQLGVLGVRDPKRPLCSFLLCGPSGVGKTHLAKLLAKYYYGNENAIVRINMGEMDEHSKARLLGSQPGTIGYDEPTPFDDLATRPSSVVLLDEVEKADAKIFDIILNAIGEEGYITLNNGKDISFRQSIVILTSNIGTRELQAKGDGMGFDKAVGEEKKKSDAGTVMKAIKKFFRPEFLNRLTGICVFNELKKDDMMKIFDLELKKINSRTEESGHIITVSDSVKERIIDKVDTKFGARDLTRKIMELISNDVCEAMVEAGDKVKKNIIVDIKKKDGTLKITFKS